jgi:hypothetical protein
MPGAFLFKTIIGKEFRKNYCIARNNTCLTCPSNPDCIYGSTLEPVIRAENSIFLVKDRATLPVIMETRPFVPLGTVDIMLRLTFIGNAIKHIPLFYSALKNRQNTPLFKIKLTYTVNDFTDGTKSLLDEGKINQNIENNVWEYIPDMPVSSAQKLLVQTQTPLRFRGAGKYTDDFSAKNFMHCLHKRMQALVARHGSNDFAKTYTISPNIKIAERNYTWMNLDHYSTRQRKVIKLGGNTGSFGLEGVFTGYETAILHFAEIFHAGEQTISGLGRLLVREKNEV